jgi:putative flippase GtrA
MSRDPARVQFLRYAVVGLASNAVLYAIYIVLTRTGTEPKIAMTLLYLTGVAQTFVFNKRWSFRHSGMHGPAFARYCAAYLLGYVANFLGLVILVDRLGYPHQRVQAVMVVALAVMLFMLQKFWVFRDAPPLPSNKKSGL